MTDSGGLAGHVRRDVEKAVRVPIDQPVPLLLLGVLLFRGRRRARAHDAAPVVAGLRIRRRS